MDARARTEDRSENTAAWQPANSAPQGTKFELRVHFDGQDYTLPFACEKRPGGWVNQEMDVLLEVDPLECRKWPPAERLAERVRSAAWPLARVNAG